MSSEARVVIAVTEDLLAWSRILDVARSAGRRAIRVEDDDGMARALGDGAIERVVVDLGHRTFDALAWAGRIKAVHPSAELVAFGSHVDEAALASARSAGFDRVLPRGAFHRSLPEILAGTSDDPAR